MRNSHWLKITVFLFVFAWVGASTASAIDLYGRIRGVVGDPSGAVVAGATVTATNTGTGISTQVISAPDGSFEFPQLPAPATYNLKCEKAGFKVYEAAGINLRVTQIFVQNVTMELGAVTQTVTVEAAPVQVEKTSMQISTTISSSEIVNLPLVGRNWVQLQQTMPGVVASSDRLTNNYSTNGSQTDSNSYLVNGVDTNDLPLNTPLIIPSPDAIAEFSMVTNSMNPEYGRNSGAVLNAVMKSGTNSFHGSAFDFYRDTSLNARNFFKPTTDIFHQNMFGGTIGGPIWKDHTFFFFSYQGVRNAIPQAGGNIKVFTADQRNGIFPALATSSKLSIFDLTGEDGTVYPAGTPYSTIFPTGHIPTVDFSPVSAGLLDKYVPLANFSGTNYTFSPTTSGLQDQYIARIDHNFGSKDAIWGTMFWQRSPSNRTLPFSGANLPGFGSVYKTHLHQYVATWNHTFNSTTLNEARIGYTRLNYSANYPANIVDPASLGFTGITAQEPSLNNVPVVSVSGYFVLGFSTNGPQPRVDQTYQVDDNFTKIMGRHTFKMGFNMRRFQVYQTFYARLNGYYTFSTAARYSTGDQAADFMLGIPNTYNQQGGDIQNNRAQEYYAYFQDQFRVRPNLTLTYGVGWTVDTPIVDNYHENHAMVAFRPGLQSVVFPNSPTGYVFQGDPGVSASGTTKYGHFGPRFGFAWSPSQASKWSVRGGYGVYFNRTLSEQTLQFVLSSPYGVSSGGVADVSTAAAPRVPNFGNPWQDIANPSFSIPNKFPSPLNPPSSTSFDDYVPLSFSNVDPNYSVPYVQNFNLTVERQLPANTILSMAYVGALGRHLVITRELNPGINAAGCAADPNCAGDPSGQITNYPQNFRYPNTLNGVTVFGSVGNIQTSGISNYNSLQVSLNKRMSHGLQLMTAYTWSHAMDDGSGFENSGFGGGGYGGYGYIRGTNPFNQALYDYGPSGYDARHRLVLSYTYDIPPIRRFNNWALKRVFEGWSMNGITSFQTGFPLDVIDSNNSSLTCSGYTFYACPDVPNLVGTVQYLNPKTNADHLWFSDSAFAPEPLGQFGNAGRNLLRGPGIANFDFGFYKRTKITESTSLELRFEFYNLFNHTQFDPSGIDTDYADLGAGFGEMVTARDPRNIQLAAKFYF